MKITKRQLRKIIRENMAMRMMNQDAVDDMIADDMDSAPKKRKVGDVEIVDGAFEGTASDRAKLTDELEGIIQKLKDDGKEAQIPKGADEILAKNHGDELLALRGVLKPSFMKKMMSMLFPEGKARLTENQLRVVIRKAIRESMDVVNVDTGEVIDFGEESMSGLPDAALPDLVKRLGLNMSPSGALSNADFEKLEDETVGKQDRRAAKRKSAQMAADRERLNIDNLLQRLRDWADGAFKEYAADNPGTDLQDVAYDLADAWEFEFAEDEREELMWHFDGDVNDLKIYAAESMG